jgi:hypothetical protein
MAEYMEEPGAQCTVVFALIVRNQLVSVCGMGGGGATPSPPTIRFRNN